MGETANSEENKTDGVGAHLVTSSAHRDSKEEIETSLLDIAAQIERQLGKCRKFSEWVLARLDEVEAMYPPLPNAMRSNYLGIGALDLLPRMLDGEAIGSHLADNIPRLFAGLSRLSEGNAPQDVSYRARHERAGKAEFTEGDVRFLVKSLSTLLQREEQLAAVQIWLEKTREIDQREGLAQILEQEQDEWSKLDELIQSASKIPVVGLRSLQAKLRIIAANNNAEAEISFGDTIDEILSRELMSHLTIPKLTPHE